MPEGAFIYRGNLSQTPLPEMLATIHRYKVPGVMELSHQGVSKSIYIVDGDVIFSTSSDRRESLGDHLLAKGKITKAQLRVSAGEMARSPGKRHGTVLVELGFLAPDELGPAVREHVQVILWSMFDWEEGEVTFRVGRFRDDEVYKLKIPTPAAIVAGCRRITDGRAVTARLGGRSTVYMPVPRGNHLTGLHLQPEEQRMLEMVDGKKTLLQLCEAGPLPPGVNARLLYAFSVLGMVEKDELSHSSGIRIQVRRAEGEED